MAGEGEDRVERFVTFSLGCRWTAVQGCCGCSAVRMALSRCAHLFPFLDSQLPQQVSELCSCLQRLPPKGQLQHAGCPVATITRSPLFHIPSYLLKSMKVSRKVEGSPFSSLAPHEAWIESRRSGLSSRLSRLSAQTPEKLASTTKRSELPVR